MNLKEIREQNNLTQSETAKILGVSLRSYIEYENNVNKSSTIKYQYLLEKLKQYNLIDEEHGILTLEKIKIEVKSVLDNYNVNFCYLFGSYAKNKATPLSDIDLIIDSEITGLNFYGLVEDLRVALHKKVDLLKINQLTNNEAFLREVMKDGIKIYG